MIRKKKFNSNSGDGTTTTRFDKTLSMPTYLLAFVVSDLEYSFEYETPSGIPNRIYARHEHIQQSRDSFPLLLSGEFLGIMEEKFNFTYDLPKLYSVAMPDHGSAMENWYDYCNLYQILIG